MARKHLYDMSRRHDNGKWEVIGKAYQDGNSGRITLWLDPAKAKAVLKNQKEDVPFILFPKEPAKAPAPTPTPAAQPQAKSPIYQARQLGAGVPADVTQAPPFYTTPTDRKASDSWPPDFDDDIPF